MAVLQAKAQIAIENGEKFYEFLSLTFYDFKPYAFNDFTAIYRILVDVNGYSFENPTNI